MIRETIKKALYARNMTRKELARQAGCRVNTISDYLNAKSEMRSDLLTKVFEIMNIKITQMDNEQTPQLHNHSGTGCPFRVLNLYACLGGNRYKWTDCEVTAVELDPELARMYKERFPNDTVIIADAHQYLLDHYKEYDFIWTSPPCPSHSRIRFNQAKGRNDDIYKAEYPNMMLYQEIILLDNYFEGKYVVENVIPYYEPLIPAKKRGRHLYWTNFNLPSELSKRKVQVGSGADEVAKLCKFHEIDLSSYKGEQRKDKIARNLVDYEAGLTIFNTARNIISQSNIKQQSLFDAVTI